MPVVSENWVFDGTFHAKAPTFPDRVIAAQAVIHQSAARYFQAGGADVVSATVPIHTFYKDGTLVAVEVTPITAPAGGNRQFTVNVQKGNQATGFVTVLSAVVTIDSSKANRQVVAGTLSVTSAADGDTLQVVVTASGSTGTQGQGFVATVTYRENPT